MPHLGSEERGIFPAQLLSHIPGSILLPFPPPIVSSFTKFSIFLVKSLMYICDVFAHPHVTSLAVSLWFQPGSLLAVAAPGGRPQKATPKS